MQAIIIITIALYTSHTFRTAAITTVCIIAATVGFVIYFGKQHSFLLINGYYNPALDAFFRYITFLGDGVIFVPVLLYCLLKNRKYLVAVIAGILISTLISQGMKHWVFPHDLRPFSLEASGFIIHQIEGVPLHRLHSFPSGHTTTAFTVAMLLAAIMRNRWWGVVLPFVAMLVAYSRVYLGQHFVTDVCAGMAIGLFSAWISLIIYQQVEKRWWTQPATDFLEKNDQR